MLRFVHFVDNVAHANQGFFEIDTSFHSYLNLNSIYTIELADNENVCYDSCKTNNFTYAGVSMVSKSIIIALPELFSMFQYTNETMYCYCGNSLPSISVNDKWCREVCLKEHTTCGYNGYARVSVTRG